MPMPANGLRLSGARKGVRCSRGLAGRSLLILLKTGSCDRPRPICTPVNEQEGETRCRAREQNINDDADHVDPTQRMKPVVCPDP